VTLTTTPSADTLEIGTIHLLEGGAIGMTRCPGKRRDREVCEARDVQADLVALSGWGATAVVTLNQEGELESLGVRDLGKAVQAAGMRWLHLPIGDMAAPDRPWEEGWKDIGPRVHQWLQAGERVVFHCGGGQGRAGTIAALTLIERGLASEDAIREVRLARPGAIESIDQERYLLNHPRPT